MFTVDVGILTNLNFPNSANESYLFVNHHILRCWCRGQQKRDSIRDISLQYVDHIHSQISLFIGFIVRLTLRQCRHFTVRMCFHSVKRTTRQNLISLPTDRSQLVFLLVILTLQPIDLKHAGQ